VCVGGGGEGRECAFVCMCVCMRVCVCVVCVFVCVWARVGMCRYVGVGAMFRDVPLPHLLLLTTTRCAFCSMLDTCWKVSSWSARGRRVQELWSLRKRHGTTLAMCIRTAWWVSFTMATRASRRERHSSTDSRGMEVGGR